MSGMNVGPIDDRALGTPVVRRRRARWWLVVGLVLPMVAGSAAFPDAATAWQTNWGQWRGPTGNGVAPRAEPPVSWDEQRNVRWRAALPGAGHASPVIWNDRIFLSAAVPIGEPQKPVYDRAPGTHDNVPVTHRHRFVVIGVSRTTGRSYGRRP